MSKVITDNCRHQLVPVADAVVPAALRAKLAHNTSTEPTPDEEEKGSLGKRRNKEDKVVSPKEWNIKRIEVQQLKQIVDGKEVAKPLSESEIINRLAGEDKTDGSCASVALAFIGNKMGLDVRDFRGGNSRDYFSRDKNLRKIVEAAGGEVIIPSKTREEESVVGWRMLQYMQEGHLYYFGCSRHVAIVRIMNGHYEFLEMQNKKGNGWYALTEETLKSRFEAEEISGRSCFIIDIDKFQNDEKFRDLLGYLNTSKGYERKNRGD